jgi:predicted TIM-barrel fold metal-dependent hydrolase
VRVVVLQLNDGVPNGVEFDVPPRREGETAAETLANKAASHKNRGWTIEPTEDGFHAWKEYPEEEYPNRPAERKDRFFRLVD